MSKNRAVRIGVVVAAVTLMMTSLGLGDIEIFPIMRAARDQQFPDVDDCMVVWQHDSNGDWDIGVADISNLNAIDPQTITDMFNQAQYPAVSGDMVVWQNMFFMFEDWDIVGLDLTTETFFDLASSYADECRPAISGNLVVAEAKSPQYPDWDIVGIDISDRSAPDPFWIDTSAENQWHVDVHDGIVVYEDTFGDESMVGGWDFSNMNDPVWFPVVSVRGQQHYPAVSGKWAVWHGDIEDVSLIGGDNMFYPDLAQTFNPDNQEDSLYPDVCNNIVVWQDHRNGNWDIYAYNLTTKETFPVVVQGADQTNPAISFSPRLQGYVVVWQDHRDGNWDIYGALIDGPEAAGCASPLEGDVNGDGVVDDADVAEVEAGLGQQNGIPAEEED